ncbi:hypothetical protein AB1Y20_007191 [Prymnesium parvum]|uniref:Uncharacterized protein n=1 Tax=Prymnesium parvum TaxID=97485 RepID=A0AB34ITT5_PRYPA
MPELEVVGRMLMKGGRTPYENALEVLSYVLSFSSFYLFVCVAKRQVAKHSFRAESSTWSRLVFNCVGEREESELFIRSQRDEQLEREKAETETFMQAAARLGICVLGIQVSYLLWGLMQERIMTRPYETGELFKSSKFLVFANRFLALFVAFVAVKMRGRPRSSEGQAPLYKYSFSSVSNILSSVFQYEALKFVSFPTQVLAKSCKMVPVMLMGYVVNRKSYSALEYAVATVVTAGATIFKLNERNDAPEKNTELVGIVLIVGYMGMDSFTSNWQSKVFKQYGVESTTMMMYSNLFSSGFTALGLLVTLEIVDVVHFLTRNPSVVPHIVTMSVCSAVGQLFIFYTIKHYGPLVFATIQTVRQLLSIVLSIGFFGHEVNFMEAMGVFLVFSALGGQILHKWLTRKRSSPPRKLTSPCERVEETSEDAEAAVNNTPVSDNPQAALLAK